METIAVRDGIAVDAAAHLERLASSAGELYAITLPDDLPDQVEQAAAGTPLGRLRVLVGPGERPTVELAPAGDLSAPGALRPHVLAGGLGAHKWLDRPGRPTDLIVDLDGSVLETGAANVWVLLGGTLVTPPADGRLLAGVTRARLLAADELATAEAPVTLDDLRSADAVLLTSSIRLVGAAAIAPAKPTPRAAALAAELRKHPAISRKTGSYIR
jgi:para-aminobenzoate synthetase/4-amino-4-deoxychorismate lyase